MKKIISELQKPTDKTAHEWAEQEIEPAADSMIDNLTYELSPEGNE